MQERLTIAEARLSSDHRLLVVGDCPFCHKVHHHGISATNIADAGGERGSHCLDDNYGRTYLVVVVP